MDTNLIGNTDKYKPIAQNILQGSLQARGSFSHDGYQNLTAEELKQVPVRNLGWFTNQIGSLVFVASHTYTALINIHDHAHAKQLYNNQAEGYSFLTLNERAQQALGEVYFDQSIGFKEPEMEKIYLRALYVNGELEESHAVQYTGFSHNLRWYVFNFVNGTDSAGNSCWLLPVGYFPRYRNASHPETVRLELYTPLN